MSGQPDPMTGDILRRKIAFLETARAATTDPLREFELDEQLGRARRELAASEAGQVGTGQRTPARPAPVDIARVERYAGLFVGRVNELAQLDRAWQASAVDQSPETRAGRPRVLSIVALGGEGKTALVARWLVAQQAAGWPGCDGVFAWSFYSQGSSDQTAVSSDLFLAEALRFFGDPDLAASAASQLDKARRLAQLLSNRRTVLVLDGLEPLQHLPGLPHEGRLADGGIDTLLRTLATTNGGLCVVTTRYRIPNLDAYGPAAETVDLTSLPKGTGAALAWRILGTSGEPDLAEQAELEAMVASVGGHALSVQLLASYLRYAFGGDLPSWRQVSLANADAAHGEHARHILDAYLAAFAATREGRQDGQLLGLTGLFDRPAPGDCFDALMAEPSINGLTDRLTGLDQPGRNLALSRLEQARLITVDRQGATVASLDAHPLLRSLLADRLRKQNSRCWRAGHERLYRHLCNTTMEGDQPTLDDLQPLYHAITHGCYAGLHEEVLIGCYWSRICRSDEFYATYKLGAFGTDLAALACFFDIPFTHPSPSLTPDNRSWLISVAGYNLRALGRLRSALALVQKPLDDAIRDGDHDNAAIRAGNLSELQIMLGDLVAAATAADIARIHADYTTDVFRQLVAHAQQGTVYQQQGDFDTAITHFTRAEYLQAIREPPEPNLYSLWGFRYCELLTQSTEIFAWRQHLGPHHQPADNHQTVLSEIAPRAAHALTIAERNHWLLDLGLDTLTLARIALHRGLLTRGTPTLRDLATATHAVNTLRQANQLSHLPPALLTRAALHTLTSHHNDASADLDEASDLTQQGPMPLYEVDTLLHRTRLYGPLHLNGTHPYPWPDLNADLDRATELIQRHGYHRRDQELADTVAALTDLAAREGTTLTAGRSDAPSPGGAIDQAVSPEPTDATPDASGSVESRPAPIPSPTRSQESHMRWLHISDFHFAGGDPYDRHVVLRALVAAAGRWADEGRRPDVIFATGDIAQSGQTPQYDAATAFFDALLAATGLGRERLFVVPGNHDVDRGRATGLARTLDTREQADAYFAPGQPLPHLDLTQAAFRRWYDGYFAGIRTWPADSTCGPVEAIDVGGYRLGVLPINSALFALDDHDHAKLIVGRRCLDGALAELESLGADLDVALVHHPLDWLHDHERPNIRARLQASIDVILRGHLHDTDVESIVTAHGGALTIAAGASYQTRRWPNRALYATFTGDAVQLLPIRYEDSPAEVWVTDPSVFPADEASGYQRTFPLPGRASPGAPVGGASAAPPPAGPGPAAPIAPSTTSTAAVDARSDVAGPVDGVDYSKALAMLRRKLAYFEEAKATTSSIDDRFTIDVRLEEIRADIARLSGGGG